jgi:hypothetical protein
MPRRRSPAPSEAFLSHSSKDHAFVKRLGATLIGHGVPVWYSEVNILGAQQWHDEIGKALDRCDWFILVLSPHSVKSKWVKRELQYVLQDDRYTDRIMPISFKACDTKLLSWTLASLQSVDFTKDFHSGCRDMLRRWGIGYHRV